MTCVALDMDETLGHFAQASQLWNASKDGELSLTDSELVACLLEIPGLFNPDLGNVMRLLSRAKKSGKVGTVVVYTNNIGDRNWPEIVTAAANVIAGHELISDVIAGYRGAEDINEPRRTTSRKTVRDLSACVPASHYIFVDNELHRDMISPIVDYIKVEPHIVTVSAKEIDNAIVRALGAERALQESASDIIRREPSVHRVGTPFSRDLAKALGFNRSNRTLKSRNSSSTDKRRRTRRR